MRDLAHRHVGSVVQIHRGPLGGRELLQRAKDVGQAVGRGVRGRDLGHLGNLLRPSRQLGARDPKRDPIQVRHWFAHLIGARHGARECFGYRVVGDFPAAARVGVHGSPDGRPVTAPDRVVVVSGLHSVTMTEPSGA